MLELYAAKPRSFSDHTKHQNIQIRIALSKFRSIGLAHHRPFNDTLVRYRVLSSSDWKLIRDLYITSAMDNVDSLKDTPEPILTRSKTTWRKIALVLSEPAHTFLVVENHEAVLATAYFQQGAGSVAEIGNVWVAPSYRRRGLARGILERMLNELERRQVRLAGLLVAEHNTAAKELYERLGFVDTGRRHRFEGGSICYQQLVIHLVPECEERAPRKLSQPVT